MVFESLINSIIQQWNDGTCTIKTRQAETRLGNSTRFVQGYTVKYADVPVQIIERQYKEKVHYPKPKKVYRDEDMVIEIVLPKFAPDGQQIEIDHKNDIVEWIDPVSGGVRRFKIINHGFQIRRQYVFLITNEFHHETDGE